jgi:phosphatidylglycerophosphate synthase
MSQAPPPAASALAPGSLVVLYAGENEQAGAGLRVAGLSLIERAARQLVRQGHRVILAATPGTPAPRPRYWPAGAEIVAVPDTAAAQPLAQARGASAVIPADLVRAHGRSDVVPLRVTDEPSRRQAEDAVFAELLRGDLGFVARRLNKPVSFRITRYLFCQLPITPNQVTLLAAVVALVGAAFLISGTRTGIVLGFFLAHVQSILDGCDGELARVRFQQSPIGEWLDTIVDDGLNLTLAVAIGVGLGRYYENPICLTMGLVSAAMLLTYNAIAYRELVRQGEGGEVLKIRWWFTKGVDMKKVYAGRRPGPGAVVMALGRRDFFIFAWLVFALLGLPWLVLPYIFLIAAGSFLVAVIQLFHRPPTP